MPRYRNDGVMPLNYSDSGGPWVEPGEVFEHEIPPPQLKSHLDAGIISIVLEHVVLVDDAHVHQTREVFDALMTRRDAGNE